MSDAAQLRKAALQALESLGLAGIDYVPASAAPELAAPDVPAAVAAATGSASAAQSATMPSRPAAPTANTSNRSAGTLLPPEPEMLKLSLPKRREALTVLAQDVTLCKLCPELARTRTQTVFGVGNPQPRLCFMGEAPGADEDRQGEPFVGRAGQLLNKIIEACTLRREDVYILNTIKCRPPDNRNPTEQEACNCRPFLDRQLEILRPEYICCLGAVAAQNLLQTTAPIGRLRKQFHSAAGAKVICTYHPAYLLRNPAAKRDVWEDMQMLMAAMGIPLPVAKK